MSAADRRILELEEANGHLQESEATATAAVAEHLAARAQQTERIKKAKAGGAKGKPNHVNDAAAAAAAAHFFQCCCCCSLAFLLLSALSFGLLDPFCLPISAGQQTERIKKVKAVGAKDMLTQIHLGFWQNQVCLLHGLALA